MTSRQQSFFLVSHHVPGPSSEGGAGLCKAILLAHTVLADVTQSFAASGWADLAWPGALPEWLAHSAGNLALAAGWELGEDSWPEPLRRLCFGLLGLLELPSGMAAGIQEASPQARGLCRPQRSPFSTL